MVEISVIVPVYNCEDFIEESIGSLLNQTFKDIEIVCIDDGSSDNSLNVLNVMANEDSRLKVFTQENQGSSIARNNALKMVTGNYVYFFDADDYIVEDGLEKAYSNAVNNDSDIVIFKYDQYIDNSFKKHYELDIEKQFPNADFNDFTFSFEDYRMRAFEGPFAPWFKLYRKEFLDKYDCFEFPANLNHNDVPFHVKTIIKASKISYLPEYLYHYRMDNPNSITNSRLKNYKDIFCIINVVGDFLKSEGLLEEFKKEFDFFKVNQITYEIRGRPDEYLYIAKGELSKIDLDNDLLNQNILFKLHAILDSDSMEEYNYKIKARNLEKKNRNLSKKNKDLNKKNKELKDKNAKLENKNKEILSSNSWKLTKPLRTLKNMIRK